MILTVTPNPCVDKTLFIDRLEPGAKIRAERLSCIAGGKGTNVSRAVHQLGRDTRAMVVIGGDTGNHVVGMIQSEGIACIPVRVASSTRTITTVLEEPIHRQTPLFEPGSEITQDDIERIHVAFAESVGEAKIVVFSGTVSDPSAASLYKELIPLAKDAGAITILDSHGHEFELGLQAKPYMVKPNLQEVEELLDSAYPTVEDRLVALEALHELGVDLAVLSLGSEGALVSRDDEILAVYPPKIEEVNAVGSGDALVAGFAIGLLEKMDLQDSARLAVAAGCANAMSWDIGSFTAGEVQDIQAKVEIRKI